MDECYTKPQGLYQNRDVDHKKLKKLILDAKLAPCFPGGEEYIVDLDEYATLCIQKNQGCLFIATNCDVVGHFTDAQERVNPSFSFTKEEVEYLTNRIQNGGIEVVEEKAGIGSTNLSMAFAVAKFVDACLHGLPGDAGVVQCAFLSLEVNPSFSFTKEPHSKWGHRGCSGKTGIGSTNLSMAFAAAKFVDACLHGLRGDAGVVQCAFVSLEVNPSFSFTKELHSKWGHRGCSGKTGIGSTNLSMAFAAAKFVDACLHGLRGDAGVVQCAFVSLEVTKLPFFASKVRLGCAGVEDVFPLGPLSA